MQRRSGRHGRSRSLLAALVTATLLVACRAPRTDPEADATSTAPPEPTVVRPDDATELARRSLEAPVLGATVSADGRTLELYALPLGTEPVAAGRLSASGEVGRDTVRVSVTKNEAAVPADAALCRVERQLHVLALALSEALGGRRVLDAASGAALTPMPRGEILRPRQLPIGWFLVEERPLREGDRQTGWTQRYGPAADQPGLVVVQRSATLGPNERYAVDRADAAQVPVRGTAGTWSRQANWSATSLVWIEGGWEVALGSWASDASPPALDEAATLAFAESLEAGLR